MTLEDALEIYRNCDPLIANCETCNLNKPMTSKHTICASFNDIASYWDFMPEKLKCTFDPAHIIYAGIPVERVLAIVGPRLAHVHLRDAVKGNSMLPYGQGCNDFKTLFRLLDGYGYKGKFSMEFPGGPDLAETTAEFKRGLAFLRKQAR